MSRKFKHNKTTHYATETESCYELSVEMQAGYFNPVIGLNTLPKWVVENSSDWTEVFEKDWEIVSYRSKSGLTFWRMPDGLFTDSPISIGSEQRDIMPESCFWSEQWFIHSVKRLSDGEMFTVGDTVQVGGEIEHIKFFSEATFSLRVYFKSKHTWAELPFISKPTRTPLFVTEDGVEVFGGDTFWTVDKKDFTLQERQIKNVQQGNLWVCVSIQFYTCFSTESAAQDFIVLNKPCLSVQDLAEVTFPFNENVINRIKQLAVEKLKQK